MPFCPRCGKRVDFLKNYVYGCTEEYNLRIAVNGEPLYEYLDTVEGEHEEYCCPKCGATLFDNREDAVKFLKDDVEVHIKAMGGLRGE